MPTGPRRRSVRCTPVGADPDRRPPLALWATPRTVSTAFDKMMRARGDHDVFTEPFSVAWYFGPERRSPRYDVSEPAATFEAVLDEVTTTARSRPVFVKDMAYHLGPLLRPDVLASFRSSFLIRDPRWSVPSMLRRWPDATPDEIGYDAQLTAFRICTEVGGAPPPVIESAALLADPPGVVARWCAAVGIEHRPGSLTWDAGQPEGWERWGDWFADAARSTGFRPPAEDATPPALHGRAADLVVRSLPAYTELLAHAL
jgi:hypothetical protein